MLTCYFSVLLCLAQPSLREIIGFLQVLSHACQCHVDILIFQIMAVEIHLQTLQ